MNVQSGFQLGDFGGVLRRRAKLMTWTGLLVALSAYWIAMALPNEFESYSTILVEPQSVSQEIVTPGVGATNLTERLGLMTAQILARPRLSKIIDDLSLYPSESEYMVRQTVINIMRKAVNVQPVIPELEKAQGVRRRDAQINTFRIVFRYENAKVASEVAQRLANDFIDEHIKSRVRQSEKSLDFINTELNRLSVQIQKIESQIAEVKDANLGRLPDDLAANWGRIDRMAGEIAYVQRDLAEARSNEAFYRDRVVNAEISAPFREDSASPQRRVKVLELALAEYAARGFTSKHPDVIRVQTELVDTRNKLEAQRAAKQDSSEEVTDPVISYAQQTADAEMRRAQLRRVAAETELARLEALKEELQALVAAVPRVAEQLDGLRREYEHLFRSYQDFSNRKLEATIQAQLERRQLGEQFRVLEQAFPAVEPSSPNRPVIVILGLFFAMAIAGGVGILLEASDPSIHTPRQLQAALAIPVLGAIPEIWLESDRKNQRRGRIRTGLATAALIVFAIVGGALNYQWVNGGVGLEPPEDAREIETERPEINAATEGSLRPQDAPEVGQD